MPEEEKLFYTIGETAQLLNVKPYVLRYWESEFKKLNPQKSETGQRTYRKKDLQVATTIKRLLYDEKYTIAGAIQKLEELEKNGLDPLGFKTTPQEKVESAPVKVAPIPEPELKKPEPVAVPIKPVYPREKVVELQTLISASHAILKKYQLN